MGYCDDPSMVRVDFFKDSGKWYTTEAIKWLFYGNESFIKMNTAHVLNYNRLEAVEAIYLSIHDIFALSLYNALGDRLSEMQAICLQPYHVDEHPISTKNWKDKALFLLEEYPHLKNFIKNWG